MQLLLAATAVLLTASNVLARTMHPVSAPTVHIRNGTVVGKHLDSHDQDLFLGIPFAEPPVGELRFNAPQSVKEAWETPLMATEYGAHCINYFLDSPLNPINIATRYL